MNVDPHALFSRETLAGYDMATIARGVVAIVGAGAAGNNIALNLAMSGVGEIRLIDHDEVEPSNLTRSPLFTRSEGKRPRMKAREVATRFLELSYATEPVVRYATRRVEELGLAGLRGCHAVIAAADSFAVRAWLADATRVLGIPLVELGFSGHEGHVSVFPNQSASEPCWRCLYPHASHGGLGCSVYARAALAVGKVPATQALAAAFSGVASEQAIQALHGAFPLAGKALHLDIHTGATKLVNITTDPACPGQHRVWKEVTQVPARSNQALSVVLEHLSVEQPVVHLPSPFVIAAPCVSCGASVQIRRPSWDLTGSPRCTPNCETSDAGSIAPIVSVSTIARDDWIAGQSCRSLGLRAAAIFEVENAATGDIVAVQLDGGVDDLFVTKRRKARAHVATHPAEDMVPADA